MSPTSAAASAVTRSPPLPGLPPVSLKPVQAPTPPPSLRRLGTSNEARFADEYESYETQTEALELDAEDLLEELDSDVAARAALALDNARLYAKQRELAEELQRSLLTPPPEPGPGRPRA